MSTGADDKVKEVEDERGRAAIAAWGSGLGTELSQLDEMPTTKMDLDEPEGVDVEELTGDIEEIAADMGELASEQSVPANLEPIGEDAHPTQNRRLPTQPPSSLAPPTSSLALAVDQPSAPNQPVAGITAPEGSVQRGLEPPAASGSRLQSPAPVRRGIFSTDRVTNMLAGGAVGMCLMIYPAKKIAESHEVSEVRPMIAELETSINQPLGVEAGLVAKPEVIAARIDDGRSKTRRRYAIIWLLFGAPIGLGLGLAPRPGD